MEQIEFPFMEEDIDSAEEWFGQIMQEINKEREEWFAKFWEQYKEILEKQ